MSEKILDINEYPFVRAYTYHAYPLSILSSKKYVGKKKIELLIDGETTDFSVETINSTYDIVNNKCTLTADEYAEDVKMLINYNTLYLFEREFKINYFQYTQPHAYIAIIISDKYNEEEIACVNFYRNGRITLTGWDAINDIEEMPEMIDSFKLAINEQNIGVEALKAGKQIGKLTKQLDKSYQDYSVTITAFLGENQYYNWFFSNYIQLYGRNIYATEYFIDYFVAPERKNSMMYTIHSLLEYHHINRRILKKCNIDLINFIKANIEDGNYVEVVLNQKFIPVTGHKKNNYFHQTLIYGYSDTEEILYIEVVGRDGKLNCTSISYGDFINASEVNYERMVVIKYDPLEQGYSLDISNVIESLVDYLQGRDYEEGFRYLLQRESSNCENRGKNINFVEQKHFYLDRYKKIYGHKLLPFFMNNLQMFDYMLRDIRIVYVWKEHKDVMLERIKFLQYRKKIDYEKGKTFINDVILLRNKLEVILNLCIKYKICPNKENENNIRQLLKIVMEDEEKLLRKLIEELQEKNSKVTF